MNIHLDETTLDTVAKAKIKDLEKQVSNLQRKLTKALNKIGNLEANILSKEKSERIKGLAKDLVAELETAKLVEFQQGL